MSAAATTADVPAKAPRAASRVLSPVLLKLAGVNATALYAGAITLVHHVFAVPAPLSWMTGVAGFALSIWVLGVLGSGRGLGVLGDADGRFRIDWLPVVLIWPIGLSLLACVALGLETFASHGNLANGTTLPLMLTASAVVALLLWQLPPWPTPRKTMFLWLDLVFALATGIAAAMLFASVYRGLQPASAAGTAAPKAFHHVPAPDDAVSDGDEDDDACVDASDASTASLAGFDSQIDSQPDWPAASPMNLPPAPSARTGQALSTSTSAGPVTAVAMSTSPSITVASSSSTAAPATGETSAAVAAQAPARRAFASTCANASVDAEDPTADDDEGSGQCSPRSAAASGLAAASTVPARPVTSAAAQASSTPTAASPAPVPTLAPASTAASTSLSTTVPDLIVPAAAAPAATDSKPAFTGTCKGPMPTEEALAPSAPALAQANVRMRTLDALFPRHGLWLLLLGGFALAAGRWLASFRHMQGTAADVVAPDESASGMVSESGPATDTRRDDALSMAAQAAQPGLHALAQRLLSSLAQDRHAGTASQTPSAVAEALALLLSAHPATDPAHAVGTPEPAPLSLQTHMDDMAAAWRAPAADPASVPAAAPTAETSTATAASLPMSSPAASTAPSSSATTAPADPLTGMHERLDQHEQAARALQSGLDDVGARLAAHEAAARQLHADVGAMQGKMEQHAQMLHQMAQHMQDSAAEARKTSDTLTRMMLGMKADMQRMSQGPSA